MFVQLSRIASPDTQVFINANRLIGVYNFNAESNRENDELRSLNSLKIKDKISSLSPENTISIGWYLGEESLDPFFDISNGEILSVESFLIEFKDLAGTHKFNKSYISSYGVEASIGGLINGEASYINDDYFQTNDKLSGNENINDSFHPFLIQKISFTQQNIENNTWIQCSIQSFSFDLQIERKRVNRIGNRKSRFYYPIIPIKGSLSISILKTEMFSVKDFVLLPKGDLNIKLESCLGKYREYSLKNCVLDDISESLDIDGNNTIELKYSFEIYERILGPLS